jgi:hypothetical protein
MNMNDALDLRPPAVEPGVDEDFLRRFQTFVPFDFFAVEVDCDDVAGSYKV